MFVLPIIFLCSRLDALPSLSPVFEVESWEQIWDWGPREKPSSAWAGELPETEGREHELKILKCDICASRGETHLGL